MGGRASAVLRRGAACASAHLTSLPPPHGSTPLPAAAARGALCVFHVGSARKVATLSAAHAKNVRGLAYDAPHNLLLTCSFDRTVKLWEADAP